MKKLIFVILILMSWGCIYASAVHAYAGNIWINSTIDGNTKYFIESTDPTGGTGTFRSANVLGVMVDPSGVLATPPDKTGNWRRYTITVSPYNVLYVLFVKSGPQYAIATPLRADGAAGQLTTTGGVNLYVDGPLTWYNAGPPPLPDSVSLALNGLTYPAGDGIVSSSISPAVPAGYQITGTQWRLQQVGQSYGSWYAGALSNSQLTNSSGKSYQVQMCYVNWFGVGPAGESAPLLIPSLGAAGPLSFVLTFESAVAGGGSGINSFSMPFAPDADGKWWAFNANGSSIAALTTNEVRTADDLVRAVNAANNANVVSTFGRWDKTGQLVKGIMISYGAGINNITGQVGAGGVTALNLINLVQGEGYQVYVTRNAALMIKNTP